MPKKTTATKAYQAGLQVRRAVLGRAYVDNAIANADEFSRPLQEFVTEYCWGGVWTRPHLTRKMRSLLNLGILTAINRPHEVEIHLRGARRNGCSWDEIREVLLHAGVYCGVPSAVDSFRIARKVKADEEAEAGAALPAPRAKRAVKGKAKAKAKK